MSLYRKEDILLEVIERRNIEDLELFCENNLVDINGYARRYAEEDFNKITPLYYAASLGLDDFVDTLCKFGADTSLGRLNDKSPALFAAAINVEERKMNNNYGDMSCFQYLQSKL